MCMCIRVYVCLAAMLTVICDYTGRDVTLYQELFVLIIISLTPILLPKVVQCLLNMVR